MDKELLMIDLLSGKKIITAVFLPIYRQRLRLSISLSLFSAGFFLGLNTLVYRYLMARVQTTSAAQKIVGLHYFALIFGGIIITLCLIQCVFVLVHLFFLKRNFQGWLTRILQKFSGFSKVVEDEEHYFVKRKQKEVRLAKKDCLVLTERINGDKLMIGVEKLDLGVTRGFIFLRTTKIDFHQLPNVQTDKHKGAGKLAIFIGLFCLLLGSFLYLFTKTETKENTSTAVAHVSEEVKITASGLLKQQGATPNKVAQKENELYVANTHELFQTTDRGQHWQFVPLKAEWLRGGSYTLTSGEIPFGYWMDYTYQVGKDFSFYLYTTGSGDYLDLYLLFSNDNGETWQKSQVGEKVRNLRYRKVQFFENGTGIAAISQTTAMSGSEQVCLFATQNHGQDWYPVGNTTINAPIQNISFIDASMGFISTREGIFYTQNGGRSYHEALVNVPEDYLLGGLDLFQSPNEVTQPNSTTLEAKFYLTKKDGHMYACLYRSYDSGQTWAFVRQLSEVTSAD
ncbi:WD40/YVTN/BNR-like repeat-containing protein [Enterococcus canintestini]|uniref:Glycosyl hydrolase n=1 Tax=Enterococcus canintestini TaxID=317010 RepID=A0A267HVV7_9ENTE|nr:hypothetical protein [Enterococcus canintestini]PAB01658.1 hypothetical protein AKL21_01645 [Enterococcus canintestini]